MRSHPISLMYLLQLASPALPVGAYSYSEGLEYLTSTGTISNAQDLQQWIVTELSSGAIRMEAGILIRAYQATSAGDIAQLWHWNAWLSATRETEELRCQSWQMGQSLLRLCQSLEPEFCTLLSGVRADQCNFAIAFAIAAHHWAIACEDALIGYLHSWATNLVNAGVKLIPLGQTAGQQLLINLQSHIAEAIEQILVLADHDLEACSWGLTLASMAHEQQYTRLFRS